MYFVPYIHIYAAERDDMHKYKNVFSKDVIRFGYKSADSIKHIYMYTWTSAEHWIVIHYDGEKDEIWVIDDIFSIDTHK